MPPPSSRALSTLLEEVQRRDDELRRETERAVLLQRMLGADKALLAWTRAQSSEARSALLHWRRAAAESGAVRLVAQLCDAQALAAEAAAQVEAEEARRAEAERLAFDEGRRRRRAEEARAAAEARVRELSTALDDAQRAGEVAARLDHANTTLQEKMADALGARQHDRQIWRAFGTWRSLAAGRARSAANDKARVDAEAAARSEADTLRGQLRTAQRDASEAQLLVLSTRQQRAEALARAAEEEQGRHEAVAREVRLDEKVEMLLVQLALASDQRRTHRYVGPAFHKWSTRLVRDAPT